MTDKKTGRPVGYRKPSELKSKRTFMFTQKITLEERELLKSYLNNLRKAE
jgi:hypothetical protein